MDARNVSQFHLLKDASFSDTQVTDHKANQKLKPSGHFKLTFKRVHSSSETGMRFWYRRTCWQQSLPSQIFKIFQSFADKGRQLIGAIAKGRWSDRSGGPRISSCASVRVHLSSKILKFKGWPACVFMTIQAGPGMKAVYVVGGGGVWEGTSVLISGE